jgi:hypothetical protein
VLNFVLVLHCHQPVGNFDHVFEMACSKSYQPILEILQENPRVRIGLHMSGPLFEWIEVHRPTLLDLIGALVDNNQVELLSGGFYEPLLASIPVRDARGQVKMMNEYLKNRFGCEPSGLWLTERIWDPGLPAVLANSGLRYTVVDDTHFYYAGLKPDEIYGHYLTEREGNTLSLLATPMIMRYLIPFKPVEEVIAHLRSLKDTGKKVIVYGDDGEKFGLWPGTHEWVIQKGWLRNFFGALSENEEWVETRLPGDVIEEMASRGRLYLPQASYEEMTEWALPSDRTQALEGIVERLKEEGRWEEWRPFVRGGVWDNFLVKYDEANRMHKKMIYLSSRLSRDLEGVKHLWRAQCNCAYWHGVFGGLYLGHLRRAVFENLLRAQELLLGERGNVVGVEKIDIDKDGEEELLIQTPVLTSGISPARGGGIFELSHIPKALNLTDVLTRRYEAYHRRLDEVDSGDHHQGDEARSIHESISAKGQGLEKALVYDRYTRMSLLEHFIPKDSLVTAYAEGNYEEWGDFVTERYDIKRAMTVGDGGIVSLVREGRAGQNPLRIAKEVRMEKLGRVDIQWELTALGDVSVPCLFGSEWNLTLFSDRDPERYYLCNGERKRNTVETGSEEGVTAFTMVNGSDGITAAFTFQQPAKVWFFPLMTVSMSEEGFERTYQGSSLLFLWPIQIEKEKAKRFSCQLLIQ